MSIGVVYARRRSLETKGYVKSRRNDPAPERGGRSLDTKNKITNCTIYEGVTYTLAPRDFGDQCDPTTNMPPLTTGTFAKKENVLENGIEATPYPATSGTTGFFVIGSTEPEDVVYTLISDIPEPKLAWLVDSGLLAIELRRKLLRGLRRWGRDRPNA